MKKTLLLLTVILFGTVIQAQKKNNGKSKPVKDVKEKITSTNYTEADPVPDTLTKFTGIIKYRITTDDPADRDSMFIIFGESQIRVTMFYPGNREKDIFEDNMIANFSDSTLLVLDNRNKTYTTEKLSARNNGTVFTLANYKKTGPVLKYTCQEYSGEMKTKEGESFEAACLVSKQHSYLAACDYNFLNIQPAVLGYKIVLGYRTKSSENENTYILAYKIEPGKVDSYFDLANFKAK